MKSKIARYAWCLLLFIGLFACDSTPRVIVEDHRGEKASFEVEIADTPAKHAFGLKYRRDLRSDQGMLFIFAEEKVHTFWMKDTPLPLDMIFIDRDRRIVGIVRETRPFSTESRSVPARSLYVLEVRGGISQKKGLGIGDTVSFESVAGHGRDR